MRFVQFYGREKMNANSALFNSALFINDIRFVSKVTL